MGWLDNKAAKMVVSENKYSRSLSRAQYPRAYNYLRKMVRDEHAPAPNSNLKILHRCTLCTNVLLWLRPVQMTALESSR